MRTTFASGLLCLALFISVSGCRSTYYSAWEKFGVYKRDLLKRAIVDARDEQKDATKQFQDVLTRLKELYGFQGGNLEKMYNELKSDYDRASARGDAVKTRIQKVEDISRDLFAEWEKEITQISSPALQSDSRAKLRDTRERYESLHRSMVQAQQRMDPVLKTFQDHVLYLKHNLNAQALSALRGEASSIQGEIQNLIEEMNASINKANEFIKTLP